MVQDDENTSVSYLCIPIPAHTYPGKQQYFDVDVETKKVKRLSSQVRH